MHVSFRYVLKKKYIIIFKENCIHFFFKKNVFIDYHTLCVVCCVSVLMCVCVSVLMCVCINVCFCVCVNVCVCLWCPQGLPHAL